MLSALAGAGFAYSVLTGRSRADTPPRPAEVGTQASLEPHTRTPALGVLPVAAPGPPATRAAPAASADRKININTASAAELDLLPGIGPSLAQRIIDYREAHGPFTSIDGLDRVKGIGPKLMAKVRSRVTLDGAPPSAAAGTSAP